MRYMGRYGAYGLMSCHMVHDGDGSWLSVMAMVHEVRCMVHSAWCMVHGAWGKVHGVGCMMMVVMMVVHSAGRWCMVHEVRCMALGHGA